MSYISETPEGDYKDFLIRVRKILDVDDGTWAGDEIDRLMKQQREFIRMAFETGWLEEDVAAELEIMN